MGLQGAFRAKKEGLKDMVSAYFGEGQDRRGLIKAVYEALEDRPHKAL